METRSKHLWLAVYSSMTNRSVFVQVAGIWIENHCFAHEAWDAFVTENGSEVPDVRIDAVTKEPEKDTELQFPWYDLLYLLEMQVWCDKLSDGRWIFQNHVNPDVQPVISSTDYRQVQIICPNEALTKGDCAIELIHFPIECRFAYEGIVSLHASCVELSGEAICFTGDSGAGKSTRAKAWVDGLGAEFISGDRPAIRLEVDGNVACGVPWDGKEQIFRNVERPLKAILEVRRAPFTRLRRLSYEQARGMAIRQAFIPMWDPDAAALAIANVHRLCRTTPVYRLFCGPDVDAARAVHRILFEHPEEIQEELPEMKIKSGFTLRHVVDEYMVMPTGENIRNFGGTVVLNEVSAFVFEQMQKSISREDLLAQILAEFDVDEATAADDLDALLEQFRQIGLLED